jgi:potassium channel
MQRNSIEADQMEWGISGDDHDRAVGALSEKAHVEQHASENEKNNPKEEDSLTVGHVIQMKMRARNIKKTIKYKKAARRVISPNSWPKMSWDSVIFLLLLYSVFEIPYSLAFEGSCDDTWREKFNLFIAFILLFDLVLNFFTAFLDEEIGALNVNLTDIARNYVKGWFIFDLASSLPFDEIVCMIVAHRSADSVMRLIQILRILKVVRILRLFHIVARLEEFLAGKSIRLLKFIGGLLLCGHICACIWYSIIELNGCVVPAGPVPTGSVRCGCTAEPAGCQEYNWLVKYDGSIYAGNSSSARYLASVYYAVVTLTTLGYGDVVPTNNAERFLSSCLALLGAVMFSFLISNISGLVSKGNAVEVAAADNLSVLRDLCTLRAVPAQAAAAARKTLAHHLARAPQQSPVARHALDGLPRALHGALAAHVAAPGLGPVLPALSADARGRLAAVLRPCALPPGAFAFQALDAATELYWVVKGEVELADITGVAIGRCI